MKRVFSLVLICVMLVLSTTVVTFATSTTGSNSLTEAISQSQGDQDTQTGNGEQSGTTGSQETSGAAEESGEAAAGSGTTEENEDSPFGKNQGFVDGLTQAADLTPEIEGTASVTQGAKLVAGFIVQVLAIFITVFLAVRVMLDLCYIALPFTRTFLANGYAGNPQQSGNMQSAGGPMGGPGMGPMGGPGMGMGYGRGYGGYNHGMGMGMGMGMGPMGMNGGMGQAAGNQRNSMLGQIQFVSNAALNAVASESAVGPDGKSVGAFRIYIKDMAIVLIVTPVLIVLAVTGQLTNLGFAVAGVVVDGINKLIGMI